jgi:hypothetical protein
MNTNENIGLFDLDGSLAGYDDELARCLNLVRHPDEPVVTAQNLRELENAPYIGARMKLIKSQPGWWAGLPLIPKGLAVYRLAYEIGFTNKILTKGPKSHSLAWKEKLDWVFNNLSDETEVTITFDKSDVYGKFLYDDYLDFGLKWLKNRPRGLVIMPVERISDEIIHPRILQYDGSNLTQVEDALHVCYSRQPEEPMVIPR